MAGFQVSGQDLQKYVQENSEDFLKPILGHRKS